MESDILEWVISIEPKLSANKKKTIKACEHIISRHGRLTDYQKRSGTQFKFNCEVMIEKIDMFLSDLEKNYKIKNHHQPDSVAKYDGKKGTEPYAIVLILVLPAD